MAFSKKWRSLFNKSSQYLPSTSAKMSIIFREQAKVFDGRQLKLKSGECLQNDRFRSVELTVTFRRLTCYSCNLTAVYKYRVKQLRRSPELSPPDDQGPEPDEVELWKSIPRFAEIPETIKCERCGEILGVYTSCIF